MTDRGQWSDIMDGVGSSWIVLLLVLIPVVSGTWRDDWSGTREPRDMRRGNVHYHSKRHMLSSDPEEKKRMERTTPKSIRDMRKKPSGHLRPLKEDDMENDEVISVAIGPPVMRPKFEKRLKKPSIKPTRPPSPNSTAVDLVREILTQLGREFLMRDASESFVFGQYVGNSMKNMTSDIRLRMQHEILDLILKYQKMNVNVKKEENVDHLEKTKMEKIERRIIAINDTDESWPDFSNLAKIVG